MLPKITDKSQRVYHPGIIPDSPFPENQPVLIDPSNPPSGDTFHAQPINDNPLPRKVIAQETIASSLNTKARKILGEYEFTEHGAIQVGKYVNGVSGDIKISPSGIVARNTSGDTTFAIDGDTGDATFKGTVQAEDFVVIDDKGLVSLTASNSDGVYASPYLYYSTAAWTKITRSDFQTPTTRDVVMLVTLTVQCSQYQVNDTLNCNGSIYIATGYEGVATYPYVRIDSFYTEATGIGENMTTKTYSASFGFTLPAGYNNNWSVLVYVLGTNIKTYIEDYTLTAYQIGT